MLIAILYTADMMRSLRVIHIEDNLRCKKKEGRFRLLIEIMMEIKINQIASVWQHGAFGLEPKPIPYGIRANCFYHKKKSV